MNRNNRFRSYTSAFVFITVESRRGFVGQITTLLTIFVYGIAQMFVLRSSMPSQGISGSQNTMTFGQMLPLLLLLLLPPCLTVLELYAEKPSLQRVRRTEYIATNELDFASSPAADKEVDSVLSSDAATNQYIPHEPDLESLLRSVNAH